MEKNAKLCLVIGILLSVNMKIEAGVPSSYGNGWRQLWKHFLVLFIVGFGIMLFVVPGIIFWCKLAFTPYLVVDRKMRAVDAIKESWRMTTGHAWKVFSVGLLAVPIFLAGLICFGVGIVISIMWVHLAFASLYLAVSRSGEALVQEGEPAT